MAKNGFTLIEFMVVVAVIGILAATSIPLYQNYVMRSQVATALAELNGARIQYELIVNNGGVGSDFTTDVMNFSNTSNVCIYKVYAPIAGVAEPALECELRNVTTSVKGQKVYLNRLANGKWQCSVSSAILDKYKPSGCI